MAIDPDQFARRLVELGEQHALTMQERAERIGISERQYARWEAGHASPRLPNVRKVADAYDIEPGELLADLGDTGTLSERLDRLETMLEDNWQLLQDVHALLSPERPADPERRPPRSTPIPPSTRRAREDTAADQTG